MNVYSMNCRNLRSLSVMLAAVIFVYVVFNVIYIVLFDESVSPDGSVETFDPRPSVHARLKFGKPDANGKVEVVVSLDVEQLAKLLGNSDLQGLYGDSQPAAESRIVVHSSSQRPPMNIRYILHNPELCSGLETSGLTWVVGIHSTPEQFDRRKLLRETWANAGLFRRSVSRTFFVMGRATSAIVQDSLQAEYAQHQDIVQGDFVDAPRNATLKGVLALHFVATYCAAAKHFIKANDDTFLNIFSMMHLLDSLTVHRHSVVCPLWKENTMPILRDPSECMQWCVAADELPGRTHFPQYCAGLAFVLSRELVSAMHTASLAVPYFWIDDVYVTGLLIPEVAKTLPNIHFVDLISNFTLVEEDIETEYQDSRKSLHFAIAKIRDAEVHRRVWKALFRRLPPSQFKLLSDAAMLQHD